MEDELKTALTCVADEFVRATGLKISTVAMRALGDARFFDRLAAGRGFNVKTYDRAMSYFSDHWPEDATWPKSVVRPEQPVSA